MEENKTWQVIITHQVADDQDKTEIIERLAALFKIDQARAAKLLSKPSTIVKEHIDEATAKKYAIAIGETGAQCKIIDTAEAALPDILEPVKPEAAAEGLIRQPAAEPALAMVAKQRQEEKDTREKLSQYQNVDSSFYCPECGTIRSSANAQCLHCGYDPANRTADRGGIKRIVYLAALLVIVVVVGGYLAMPFYQQYAKQASIKNGLQLAFDTRNQISQFIQETNFWPNQNIDANLPKVITNEVIAGITITGNGGFTVILHEHVLGKENQTLVFKPKMLKGKLVWNCTEGTLENTYRPDICKTGR